MNLNEKRKERLEALRKIDHWLKEDEAACLEFLKTKEGAELYKIAMTEVVADIEISITQGEITFNFDEGEYLLSDYNEEDRYEIRQILWRHLANMLDDIVEVLNRPKEQY